MIKAALLGIMVSAATGCASNFDVVDYRVSGPIDLQHQDDVKQRWATMEDQNAPAPQEVEVFQQSGPPGVILQNGSLLVQRRAPYKILGSFRLNYRKRTSEPSTAEAVEDVKRLGASAGGNVVVVFFDTLRDNDTVWRARGFVLERVIPARFAPPPDPPRPMVAPPPQSP